MKKVFETLKFVLRAILFAFILVNLGKIWHILASVFTWCTTTDLGYVWVINIAVGAIVVGLIGLATRKYREQYAITIGVIKTIVFILVVWAIECFVWHLGDSWEMLKEPVDSSHIILAVIGLVAATLSFVWHLRGVNYDEEYYDDYEDEEEKEDKYGAEKKAKAPEAGSEVAKEAGSGTGSVGTFEWGGGDSAK